MYNTASQKKNKNEIYSSNSMTIAGLSKGTSSQAYILLINDHSKFLQLAYESMCVCYAFTTATASGNQPFNDLQHI